jgi:hypothetical protein
MGEAATARMGEADGSGSSSLSMGSRGCGEIGGERRGTWGEGELPGVATWECGRSIRLRWRAAKKRTAGRGAGAERKAGRAMVGEAIEQIFYVPSLFSFSFFLGVEISQNLSKLYKSRHFKWQSSS